MYEMIVGIPPFYNENNHTMFQNIKFSRLHFPNLKKHGVGVSS